MIGPQVQDIAFSAGRMTVALSDGRALALPLSRYPRLMGASLHALESWELCAAGTGIHWPLIDEDLSLDGLLHDAGALPLADPQTSSQHSPSP